MNVNAVNIDPGSTRVLVGDPQYLGSFVYHVSEDAAGEFRFCLFDVTLVTEFGDWGGVTQCITLFVEPCIGLADDTPCDNGSFCDGTDSCLNEACTPLGIDPCPGVSDRRYVWCHPRRDQHRGF